jgi:hypothetical protein
MPGETKYKLALPELIPGSHDAGFHPAKSAPRDFKKQAPLLAGLAQMLPESSG